MIYRLGEGGLSVKVCGGLASYQHCCFAKNNKIERQIPTIILIVLRCFSTQLLMK